MTKNNANYELKVILDKYAQDYAHTAEASRNAFMQSAKGGDIIPVPGRIYGNDYRAQFEEQCRGYQAEAAKILDEVISATRAEATEAPSQEAVRVVQMLQLREELTADEVHNLLSVYGSNAQAYKAIASVAASKGVRVMPCSIDEELKGLEALKRDMVRTLTLANADRGHATDGFIAFFKSVSIDAVLPTDNKK